MIVHVLTAVTRPSNLPRLCTSIHKAARKAGVSIVWHWRFDPDHQHIGGQALKNEMMKEVRSGWIYILDDDTVVHPKLFTHLSNDVDAIVVSMHRDEHPRYLRAAPQHAVIGQIDMGQAVFKKKLVTRTIPIHYSGDGEFLQSILKDQNVRYIDESLSYYNKLRNDA